MNPRPTAWTKAGTALAATLLLGTLSLTGQTVNWSSKVIKTSDTEAEIQFTADIPDGWHIYSKKMDGVNGPLPTLIDIQPVSGNFQALGDVDESTGVITKFEPTFNVNVSYFEKQAVFAQKIKISPGAPVEFKAVIEWMMCNSKECKPPDEVVIAVSIP